MVNNLYSTLFFLVYQFSFHFHRVVTAAMNLADSVKIKGAFSNKNMEGMEAEQKTEVLD